LLAVLQQGVLIGSLERQQPWDLCREQPLPLVAHRQGFEHILLRVLHEFCQRGWWLVPKRGRLGRDKDVVEVLEVVDCCVLWGRNVDAHCACVDEFVDCFDCGEGGDLAFLLCFSAPGLDVRILGDVGVLGVFHGEHALDEFPDSGPHEVHVLRVYIISVLLVIEVFQRKAAIGKVVGDVSAHEVEVFVEVHDQIERLFVLHADEAKDYLGDESLTCRSIQRKGAKPVRLEKPEDDMVNGKSPVSRHENSLLYKMRVGEVSGNFVANPVGGLGGLFRVSPWPVALFICELGLS
jgi:hypothetical protein